MITAKAKAFIKPPAVKAAPTRPAPMFTGRARPHYFLPGTVLDAALNRMRWLFDEFDNQVTVATSGGKDSTVVLELAAIVNNERGQPRGPLKAMFLDQEAEFQAAIDYMRYLAYEREDIDLDWYQIPFRLFNTTSHEHQWGFQWDPGRTPPADDPMLLTNTVGWMRPKEPTSIHVNEFRDGRGRTVDRFAAVLDEINKVNPGVVVTGMRGEESLTRWIAMTSTPVYKWVTWVSAGPFGRHNPQGAQFHPIYDWTHRDVWKAIFEHGWRYCTFYDAMFRYGIPLKKMRVSSFTHERSAICLRYLQEIEPETWERATARYHGINAYGHVGTELTPGADFSLPYMFRSWMEYLEHLIENLAQGDDNKRRFRRMMAKAEKTLPFVPRDNIAKEVAKMVITNDVYGSKLNEWVTKQVSINGRAHVWDRQNERSGWTLADDEGRSR